MVLASYLLASLEPEHHPHCPARRDCYLSQMNLKVLAFVATACFKVQLHGIRFAAVHTAAVQLLLVSLLVDVQCTDCTPASGSNHLDNIPATEGVDLHPANPAVAVLLPVHRCCCCCCLPLTFGEVQAVVSYIYVSSLCCCEGLRCCLGPSRPDR
jgi:hypothetical protein